MSITSNGAITVSQESTGVTGYCDALSCRPGDRVRFMVGTQDPSEAGSVAYRADVVRLRCIDLDPDGAGCVISEMPDSPVHEDVARAQRVDRGSRVVVPASPALGSFQSFTVQALIWPTAPTLAERTQTDWVQQVVPRAKRTSVRQALLGNWDDELRAGFALVITETGTVALMLGDGRGRTIEVATSVPLQERRWARVSATYDHEAGRVRVAQTELRDPHAITVGAEPVIEMADVQPLEHTVEPLQITMAAWRKGGDGRGAIYDAHYDGKLESPILLPTALDDVELESLEVSPPTEALRRLALGSWDFSVGIAGRTVVDRSPNGLAGRVENLPTRAVTGHRWDGRHHNWTECVEQYGAIHFHSDDLYDAGWAPAFELQVPEGWQSGIYAARLRTDRGDELLPFFVNPPRAKPTADVAFLASTATFLAYANSSDPRTYMVGVLDNHVPPAADLEVASERYGGSCYFVHSDGSGVTYSSHLRPVANLRPRNVLWNFNADTLVTGWLDHTATPHDVITDHALHDEGMELLSGYRVLVTGTHPEYWTTPMLDALTEYLAGGGRLMYLGGNGFYWRIALSSEWPAAIEVRRTDHGTWKAAPGEHHHAWTGEPGGVWRNLGRTPNQLVGNGYVAICTEHHAAYQRQPGAFDARAAFIMDGVERDTFGDFGRVGGAAGDEVDRYDLSLGSPKHALVLATARGFGAGVPEVFRSKDDYLMVPPPASDDPEIRSDVVFFETPSGGAVFSTGSIAWSGSLAHNGYVNDIARITQNVLGRFADPAPFLMP